VAVDLEPGGVLHARHVAHLLQQRHVRVRLDVAGDAGVSVPVPVLRGRSGVDELDETCCDTNHVPPTSPPFSQTTMSENPASRRREMFSRALKPPPIMRTSTSRVCGALGSGSVNGSASNASSILEYWPRPLPARFRLNSAYRSCADASRLAPGGSGGSSWSVSRCV
jgi:hypothetical protein